MSHNHFKGLFYQRLANAAVTDLTPPTFSGLATLVARPNGSLRVTWAVASDATTPIRYEVYIQASTNVGLFNVANIAYVTNALTIDIFQLANASLLIKGTTYHVGVRAVDAVGNRDTNVVSDSEVSTGVLDDDLATIAAALAATQVSFAATQVSFAATEASLAATDISLQNVTNDLENIADRVEIAANLTIAKVM
jgi:uncharacterized membrane protein